MPSTYILEQAASPRGNVIIITSDGHKYHIRFDQRGGFTILKTSNDGDENLTVLPEAQNKIRVK